MALQTDLPVQVRGDTWVFKFIMQDTSGVPIDITGNEYTFTLKNNPSEDDNAAVLQIGPFVAGAESVNGVLDLIIPSVNTNALGVNKSYYYDLQEVTPLQTVSTLMIGKVKVSPDITRNADYQGGTTIVSSVAGNTLMKVNTLSTDPYTMLKDGIQNLYFVIDTNSMVTFDIKVVCKDVVTGNAAAFAFIGAAKNVADTVSLLGGTTRTIIGKDLPGYDAYIEANNTNNSVDIIVTSASSNDTRWVAEIEYTEVKID